jgi:hypothetical protein
MVEALRVGGGRLRLAGKVRIAYDGVDPDLPEHPQLHCTGSVRYIRRADRGYFLEVESKRDLTSDLCLADGAHRFELTTGGLRRK